MFFKQQKSESVRFIFMKLGGGPITTGVYQIDVAGLRLEWIRSFAPSLYNKEKGLLYLTIDVPVAGASALIPRDERRVLVIGANESIHEYNASAPLWFLERRLASINLQAVPNSELTPVHRPCAWCGTPTTMQDDATHYYYCDSACQALRVYTKRLL